METINRFTSVASLIGEPTRATMLWNLIDGRAYTAGELASIANVSPQGASNHLNKLIDADFIKVEKQGKHRYYRLSNTEVAYAIEAIANLITNKNSIRKEVPYKNGDIQYCRKCYDHLAGKIAVDLTQTLLSQGLLILQNDDFIISPSGSQWFEKIGIDVDVIMRSKRRIAKPCLDWTERKYHLAGALGANLLKQMQIFNWVRTVRYSRVIILTGKGEADLKNLGIKF